MLSSSLRIQQIQKYVVDKLLHHIFKISVTSGENGYAQRANNSLVAYAKFFGERIVLGGLLVCLIRCHVTCIPGDVSKLTFIKTTHTHIEDDRKVVVWCAGW